MGGPSNYTVRLMGFFRRSKKTIGKKYKAFLIRLRRSYREHKDYFLGLGKWCFSASLYGLMFNVPAAWVGGLPLNLKTFIGWSLIGYVLFVEVPDAVRSARR